jgi:hypothetical protein
MVPSTSSVEVASDPGAVASSAKTIPASGLGGNEDRGTSFEDIFHTFFFRAFKGPPAVWKFLRSCTRALFCPASLKTVTDCGPKRRYLSAVHLAESVFSIAAATSIVNLYSAIEAESQAKGSEVEWFVKYLIGWFQSAYLLWLFATLLIASLVLERMWLRFTRAQVESRRELASLFVYEVCLLLLPLLGILWIGGYRILEPLSAKLWRALVVYGILAALHLFVFLFRLGCRARLPLWRRVWTSALVLYLAMVAILLGQFAALPFLFLPLLLVLYPLYALLRDYLPKPRGLKRLFDRVQSRLETSFE